MREVSMPDAPRTIFSMPCLFRKFFPVLCRRKRWRPRQRFIFPEEWFAMSGTESCWRVHAIALAFAGIYPCAPFLAIIRTVSQARKETVTALLLHPTPDALPEYSVIYGNRAQNRMARHFHGVMRDIFRLVKSACHAKFATGAPLQCDEPAGAAVSVSAFSGRTNCTPRTGRSAASPGR
jgi:hypothetical protein